MTHAFTKTDEIGKALSLEGCSMNRENRHARNAIKLCGWKSNLRKIKTGKKTISGIFGWSSAILISRFTSFASKNAKGKSSSCNV